MSKARGMRRHIRAPRNSNYPHVTNEDRETLGRQLASLSLSFSLSLCAGVGVALWSASFRGLKMHQGACTKSGVRLPPATPGFPQAGLGWGSGICSFDDYPGDRGRWSEHHSLRSILLSLRFPAPSSSPRAPPAPLSTHPGSTLDAM